MSAAGVSIIFTKSRPPTDRSLASTPDPARTGRERCEQGGDELVADPVPRLAEREPGVTVAGMLGLHQSKP